MYRIIPPIIAFSVVGFFVGNASYQMSKAGNAITAVEVVTPTRADEPRADPPADPTPEPRPTRKSKKDTKPGQGTYEPVHRAIIRFMTDLDDLLDNIHDDATFRFAKPKLLRRAREHVAYAAEHRNQGMTDMSKSAAAELQKAIDRHAESLERATRAVPGVRSFFDKDLAAILNAK